MKNQKCFFYALGGFCLGVLLTSLVWSLSGQNPASEPLSTAISLNGITNNPDNSEKPAPKSYALRHSSSISAVFCG